MGISRHHHNFLSFPKVLGSLGCQTTPDQREAPVLEHTLLRGHALRAVGCERDFPGVMLLGHRRWYGHWHLVALLWRKTARGHEGRDVARRKWL